MMKKKIARLCWVLFGALVVAQVIIALRTREDVPYQKTSGFVFGTSYNITYQYGSNLKADIEAVMKNVDNSLSPFNKESVITAINEGTGTEADDYLAEVFTLAEEVNKETHGAFDITVAPLVNAWGFGFKTGNKPSAEKIDSMMQFIGMSKVSMDGKTIKKSDARLMLDCSAIAKGFGVDKVAEFLSSKGIENYIVEIGGEIVARGKNPKGKAWQVGVTKPTDDSLSVNTELQTVLTMENQAMATSGNYRNFYYEGGKKYAHTIDPRTGMPAQKDILSATVIAKTCAIADAYATAFMVLGLEDTKKVLGKHPELKAYLILSDNTVWQ